MLTTLTDGSTRVWKATAASSAVFQVATPPDSTPHMGSAASKEPGYRWIRPAVMMPPSEWPQAIVCRGRPTILAKVRRVAIWSGSADAIDQPVIAYEEPASA